MYLCQEDFIEGLIRLDKDSMITYDKNSEKHRGIIYRSNIMYRILIVEDDQVIGSAIKKHIETWDCKGRCIEDYKQVLREFVEFDPHLIFMGITGVVRLGKYPKYRLYLSLLHQITLILLWQLIWGETILLPNPLI